MAENGKPKLAMYWASACGGCEISVLNIHENILTVDEIFDIAFFPASPTLKQNMSKSTLTGTLMFASSTERYEILKMRKWLSSCEKNQRCWWLTVPARMKDASQHFQI